MRVYGAGAVTAEDISATAAAGPPRTASDGLPQVFWTLGAIGLAASTVIAVMSVATGGAEEPAVLLGVVPRAWWGFLLLHVVGVVLLCCATLVRWSREVDDPASRRPLSDAVLVAAASAGLYVVSLASLLVGLLFGLLSSYSVLGPPSERGCRVVVREGTVSGAGEIFLLPASAVRAREAGAYSAGVGQVPASAGDYDLRWEGETALLDVHGLHDRAVESDVMPLPCR